MLNEDLNQIYLSIISEFKEARYKIFQSKELELSGYIMRFHFIIKGERPINGYPLYIGLHGGGGCPVEVNDSQWENHKKLYNKFIEDSAIIFIPRAPEDCWNMWHKSYIDDFLDYIIQTLLILELINSNRVYLSGYSAGGDGCYKLAPRLADRFAGVAMMAGHPNGAKLESLRNTFFSMQVGEDDDCYSRNEICKKYIENLNLLHANDPLGYNNFCKVHEGYDHWMELKDAVVFEYFKGIERIPLPEKIVWCQCYDNPKKDFYYLSLPDNEIKPDTLLTLTRIENTFYIESKDINEITIYLNEKMIDFQKKVSVYFNSLLTFNDFAYFNKETMIASIYKKFDPNLIFTSQIHITKPISVSFTEFEVSESFNDKDLTS